MKLFEEAWAFVQEKLEKYTVETIPPKDSYAAELAGGKPYTKIHTVIVQANSSEEARKLAEKEFYKMGLKWNIHFAGTKLISKR